MKKNKFYLIFTIILTSIFFSACTSTDNKSTASSTMESYISAINEKDYKKAYEYLSSHCKEKVPYEKYADYQEVLSKIVLKRDVNYKNEELLDEWVNEDGIEFKNVTKVLENQNAKIYSGNKTISETGESYRYLIKEDGEYKVIWSGLFTENYSISYSDIAWQNYDTYKFKEAIEYSDKALDIWSNNHEAYMIKASSNYELKNYKDAMNNIEIYIRLLEDKEYISKYFSSIFLEESLNPCLSAAYNIKGLLLEFDGDIDDAKNAYEYSISLNSENESAKKNLESLKRKL